MACANTDMLKEKQLVIGLQGHGATKQLEAALNKIRRNNAMPVQVH